MTSEECRSGPGVLRFLLSAQKPMTNPVRETRLASALVKYRENKHPYFPADTVCALQEFFLRFGIHFDEDGVMDFWTWFCPPGHIRSITAYTQEEILWGLERFIDKFSPLDGDYEAEDEL